MGHLITVKVLNVPLASVLTLFSSIFSHHDIIITLPIMLMNICIVLYSFQSTYFLMSSSKPHHKAVLFYWWGNGVQRDELTQPRSHGLTNPCLLPLLSLATLLTSVLFLHPFCLIPPLSRHLHLHLPVLGLTFLSVPIFLFIAVSILCLKVSLIICLFIFSLYFCLLRPLDSPSSSFFFSLSPFSLSPSLPSPFPLVSKCLR